MPKSKKKKLRDIADDEIAISHADLRKAIESAYYAGHQTGREAATYEEAEIEAELNLTINP